MTDGTASSGTASTPPVYGVVSGSVLRGIREQLGLSQMALAAALFVDVNTLKGWETGRRPLANTKAATLRGVVRHLRALGASDGSLARLDLAVDVDVTLGLITAWDLSSDVGMHPLATAVNDRDWHDVLSPALKGAGALLPVADREHLFDRLRAVTEIAQDSHTPSAVLLRRQCAYMVAAWDPNSEEWLAEIWRQELRAPLRRDGWSPRWVAHRSLAVGRAVAGDTDDIRRFIAEHLVEQDDLEVANLNYWAYWIGEPDSSGPPRNDEFMATPHLGDWRGDALLEHLSSRLVADPPHLELTVHSLWALVTQRPRLLARRPDLADHLQSHATLLLDSPERENLSVRAVREMDQMHYATRLTKGMT